MSPLKWDPLHMPSSITWIVRLPMLFAFPFPTVLSPPPSPPAHLLLDYVYHLCFPARLWLGLTGKGSGSFITFLFWGSILCSSEWPWIYCAADDNLTRLSVCLSLSSSPLKHRDYRVHFHTSFYVMLRIEYRSSCRLRKDFTNWATSPVLGYPSSLCTEISQASPTLLGTR